MTAAAINFNSTAAAALGAVDRVLASWLPDGKRSGPEYVARNPTRGDNKAGSFSINTLTGRWSDFATGDAGGDLVALVAYLERWGQAEAETKLADFLGLRKNGGYTGYTRRKRTAGNLPAPETRRAGAPVDVSRRRRQALVLCLPIRNTGRQANPAAQL